LNPSRWSSGSDLRSRAVPDSKIMRSSTSLTCCHLHRSSSASISGAPSSS
jgi:hypothetical protein